MLAVGLLLVVVFPALARQWTDSTGKFSVEAELVEVQDGKVLLKKTSDSTVITVPVARLSEADRRYLQSISQPDAKKSDKSNDPASSKNGAGIVIEDEPPGSAGAQGKGKRGDGMDHVFGKLSTLDRRGRPGELKLAPDGVERFYIEGGTAAVAIWTFKGISEDEFPRILPGESPNSANLPVEMSFRAFRPPYRPLPARALTSISVKNPKTGTRSNVWLGELLQDARSPARVARIPRQIGVPQPKSELFRDFVAEGSTEIIVQSLEPGVFLGVGEQDLRLLCGPKRLPVGGAPPEATHENVLSERERPGASGAPYARAIAACRGAWPKYEGAIFEFTADDAKRQGIFLEDEVRIANELHAVLKQCLADMQPKLQEANDGKSWFQVAIIHSLLGQDADALGYFAKAAELDRSYRGVYHFLRGNQCYADADLVKAHSELSEAIRLNPENAFAYALRARVAAKLDQPSAQDQEKARQLDPSVDSPRRTLPWRTLYPLEESLRELGKQIPKKLSNEHPQF